VSDHPVTLSRLARPDRHHYNGMAIGMSGPGGAYCSAAQSPEGKRGVGWIVPAAQVELARRRRLRKLNAVISSMKGDQFLGQFYLCTNTEGLFFHFLETSVEIVHAQELLADDLDSLLWLEERVRGLLRVPVVPGIRSEWEPEICALIWLCEKLRPKELPSYLQEWAGLIGRENPWAGRLVVKLGESLPRLSRSSRSPPSLALWVSRLTRFADVPRP
jgi:hypothetical protein